MSPALRSYVKTQIPLEMEAEKNLNIFKNALETTTERIVISEEKLKKQAELEEARKKSRKAGVPTPLNELSFSIKMNFDDEYYEYKIRDKERFESGLALKDLVKANPLTLKDDLQLQYEYINTYNNFISAQKTYLDSKATESGQLPLGVSPYISEYSVSLYNDDQADPSKRLETHLIYELSYKQENGNIDLYPAEQQIDKSKSPQARKLTSKPIFSIDSRNINPKFYSKNITQIHNVSSFLVSNLKCP